MGCHILLHSLPQSYIRRSKHTHKEGWAPKNWCFQVVVLKTLESPLGSKETKSVNPKGNQPWIFFARTDDEAEAPLLWPPDWKSQLIGKHSDAGKDWGQKEKGVTEDEIVGWHYLLNGHEFAQTLGDSEGQGNLPCCSPWDRKTLDSTLSLNSSNKHTQWKKIKWFINIIITCAHALINSHFHLKFYLLHLKLLVVHCFPIWKLTVHLNLCLLSS